MSNNNLKASNVDESCLKSSDCKPLTAEAINTMEHYKNLSLEDIDGEIWKYVPDYEGIYQASNFGRVKSFSSKSPRILSAQNNGNGYLTVNLGFKNKFYIHRLVAICFLENPYNYPMVNHKNGIKSDNCLYNLEWCTSKYNVRHAFKNGLMSYHTENIINKVGEDTTGAKLKTHQVLEIRNKYKNRVYTLHMLSLEYSVSISCISAIINNKRWKHI